ncbi:reverse transcriptase domain-containing protein, partial [Tanacetum coccineum]
MSTHSGPSPIAPTSAVRNTAGQGKEISQGNLNGPASDASLREYCDKHYNQLLPILAEKMHQEKVQQEKLKAVKARLNFEEVSQHSESGTPSRRRDLRKRLGSRRIRSVSGSVSRTTAVAGILKVVTKVPAQEEQNSLLRNTITKEHPHAGRKYYQKVKPWVCEETDPFTPRIRYFDLPKRTRIPSHLKTYDESEDPEDHLNIFQAAAKVERWAMPTWCHMFNSTLTGSARVWFDDLPPESVDSYDDLKETILANFRQQKKCIKDHVEIHHIKQREGESTEDFMRRFKVESRDVKGALEVMRISGFMHGITNPELIKHLHEKIPKSVDEMMRITTLVT